MGIEYFIKTLSIKLLEKVSGHDPWEYFPLLIGTFIVSFSLVSLIIKEWLFLSEALVATVFGIVVGPLGFNFVNPTEWENIDRLCLEFSRLVIALQVFAAGVNLPKAYLVKEIKSLSILLLPVMFVMWGISALTLYYFLPFNMLESLLIAACITPTDPVLANSIVRGRFAESHVPIHVRNIISAESGANDGLGFPYVFFPLLVIRSATFEQAMSEWALSIWLYQIILSIVIGFLVGYVARKLLFYCETRELIDKESFLVFGFALALMIMGLVGLMRSDDLLACFIAGNSFTWDDWFRIEIEQTHMQEVVDMFFNLSFFIFFGTIVPWNMFHEIGILKLTIVSVIILLFRRVPIVLALKPWTPALHNYNEAFFAGWFGPIGVGAVFYAMVTKAELANMGESHQYIKDLVFPVAAFLILASVLVHGMTVPLFKLTTSLNTNTLTNITSITNMVARLPILKPGQTIVIGRNIDMSTEIIISQSNTPNTTINGPSSSHTPHLSIPSEVIIHSDGPFTFPMEQNLEHTSTHTLPERPKSIIVLLTPDGAVQSRVDDYFHDRAAEVSEYIRPQSVYSNRYYNNSEVTNNEERDSLLHHQHLDHQDSYDHPHTHRQPSNSNPTYGTQTTTNKKLEG